jgi:hypothetical protein
LFVVTALPEKFDENNARWAAVCQARRHLKISRLDEFRPFAAHPRPLRRGMIAARAGRGMT